MVLPTVTEFFNKRYFPNRIEGKLDFKTEKSYRETIKHFVDICGDLPLDQVDDDQAGKFVVGLMKKRGKREPTMMRSSVSKHVVNMKSMFRMAGPRFYCPYGLNLIQTLPYFEAPRLDKKKPKKDFLIEELHAMFRSADVATFPGHLVIDPPSWWRALFVFGFYTGLRITALVSVEYDMIFQNWLDIPAQYCKGRNATRQYVHPVAMEYIEKIRVEGRKQIFGWEGWSKRRRYAYNQLRKIQAAAGIRENRRFAFHSIRSAHCTEIVRNSMDQQAGMRAAQQSVGHADLSVTMNHYVNGDMMDDMKVTIIHRLPSPVPPELVKAVQPIVITPAPVVPSIARYAEYDDIGV